MTSTMQKTDKPSEIVAALIGGVDGELTSKSRVVDGLLDLRNASVDPVFTGRLDELLSGIPGVSTVPNGWWLERLEELRDLHA